MTWDWQRIEQYEGFRGLKSLAEREVIPALEAMPDAVEVKSKFPVWPFLGILAASIFGSLILTGILSSIDGLFRNAVISFLVEFLSVVVQIVAMCVVLIAFVLFTIRDKLAIGFVNGKSVFMARAKAWTAVCDHIGLTYVPAPAGAPRLMKMFANSRWATPGVRDVAEMLDAHAGMDEPLEVFQASGLALSNVIVLGDEAARANAVDQTHANLLLEDGFRGERNGHAFDMFEWVQKEDEAPDIHHLIIVMKAPMRLTSTTQMRARKVAWPNAQSEGSLHDVDLGPKEFDATYRLRSTDQVEARAIFNPAVIERVVALAHGNAFRAVAKDEHIVFDIAGGNRFDIIELIGGEWSDESIRKGITDIAEALELIDTLAHAFMIHNQPGGMTPAE